MPRTASQIPVGTQFSPDLIELDEFVKALVANSGDRKALQSSVWSPPVHLRPPHGVPPSRRRTNLPLEAAVQYGLLVSRTYVVTELARKLATLPHEQIHEEFARHILLRRGGARVVEAVEQMNLDRMPITADSLARYLTSQGFRVTEHNTAINSLRMWLAKAGIFSSKGWDIDLEAKHRIMGLSAHAMGVLTELNDEQRAFVQALCRINPTGWIKASDVRDLAETTGLRLSRSSLPQEFLRPLEAAGLIEFQTKGTAGGKSALLRTTGNFQRDILRDFLDETAKTLDKTLVAYFRRRPEDIYKDLQSSDRLTKGQALEAFAIYVMRLLGLRFIAWRKRARETGGAEVDVILTGILGGIPTRWQVQCKNAPKSSLDIEDVAREVGVALVSRATHVLMIANSPITREARNFAASINTATTLPIYLLDKRDFEEIRASPGVLGRILRAKAEEILSRRV